MRTTLKTLIATILIFVFGSTAFAAGKARVEVTGKSPDKKTLTLTFKTIASDGLAINADGPWKLEIKDPGSLKFEKMEFKRSEWKQDLAGFSASATPTKEKSASIKYKLVAFICTKDKSQCFREVIEDTAKVTW